MALKFGMFLLMQSPDMLPSEQMYQNAIEQVEFADQLGLDYVVLAEHHFSSYGFLPNPLVFIPKLADRAPNIRFSTAVVVLPLHNPIQLAEEIAMVDHLTGGRLDVGFGTGYQEYEFQRFDQPLAENRARFDETLDVVVKALTQAPFSHSGHYYQIPETTTLPRPLQQPHPRFWRATSSLETMTATLKRGMNVITGGTASSMDRVINSWHLFQDAVEAAEVGWPQEFIVQRGIYVSDTEEDAKAQLHHAVWHTRTARGLSSNSLPVEAGRAMTEQTERVAEHDDPEFLYRDWFFGTPEIVAEKLRRLTQYTGVTYFNGSFSMGSLPQDKVLRSMELFATKVMPLLREYEPDQSKYPRRADAPDPQDYYAWEEGMPATFG